MADRNTHDVPGPSGNPPPTPSTSGTNPTPGPSTSAAQRPFTVAELREHDGQGPSGRILVALNGLVYDVTDHGGKFYGKGGPYEMFAGRDATRGLSAFSLVPKKDVDELDLSSLQVRHYKNSQHWEKTFRSKYEIVGTLKDGAQWDPKIVKEYEEEIANNTNDKPPPEFGFKDTAIAPKSPDVALSSYQSAAPMSRDTGQQDDGQNGGRNGGQSKKNDAPSNGNSGANKLAPDTKAKDQTSDTATLKKKKTSSLCILI